MFFFTMIELLTTAEMAEADRLTIAAGTAGITLMENAGRAVADVAGGLLQGRAVIVVAGPGNNGGDGFVAARVLAERGHNVHVSFVGDRGRLKGDAALAAERWRGPVDKASPSAITGREVLIDALFGAGLDRAVEGEENASGTDVLRLGVDLVDAFEADDGGQTHVKAPHHPPFL
ncbi:MAG: NAD(P)H-hydrate epimerase [Candidatus Sulfotelmatobacter sp.]